MKIYNTRDGSEFATREIAELHDKYLIIGELEETYDLSERELDNLLLELAEINDELRKRVQIYGKLRNWPVNVLEKILENDTLSKEVERTTNFILDDGKKTIIHSQTEREFVNPLKYAGEPYEIKYVNDIGTLREVCYTRYWNKTIEQKIKAKVELNEKECQLMANELKRIHIMEKTNVDGIQKNKTEVIMLMVVELKKKWYVIEYAQGITPDSIRFYKQRIKELSILED